MSLSCRASALTAPCQNSSLELQALKCCRTASFGAVPLGLAPALRVHRISTNKEGHKMTTTTDRSELLAQLSEGIANLTTSDEWQRYLDCQSRFYRYSPNNVMLIAQQRHEATYIAGFNAWKKHNRFVRKGEKAIWILAPMVYTQTDEKTDEEQVKVIRGFKWVPVFDIASTDGEDLPTICNKLDGDDPAGLFAHLIEVANSIGFTVEDAELPSSVNGDCSHSEHRIRVEITNSPGSRTRHERLHLRLRRNVGRWRRAGHRWDQRIVRAHPRRVQRRSCGPSSPQAWRSRRHRPPAQLLA